MNDLRATYHRLANHAYANGEWPILLPSGDLQIPSSAEDYFIHPEKWTRNFLTHGDISKLVTFFNPEDEKTLERTRQFMNEHGIFLRTVQFSDLNKLVQEQYELSIDAIVET